MNGGTASPLPVAVVTGAHGGLGIACARVFSRRYRLVITDRDPARLGALSEQLANDGADIVAAIPGDLSTDALISQLVEAAKGAGRLRALVHTAGLSPSLAGWEPILKVNLTTSLRLLDAFEPLLEPGVAGVIIASIAGHSTTVTPQITAAVDAVIERGDEAPLAAIIQAAGPGRDAGAAYALSKYGVLRLVEKRAIAWARRGARLTSISPGLISTPMGRLEAKEVKEAGALLEATPIGRWGTSLDIANAAEFLCSDLAGFITGCDLRVDGGVTPVVKAMMEQRAG